jgi:hypothetical protein
MGMAPFKLPPSFKFHFLFSGSKSVNPNPYQLNAKVKCPSSIVNPALTLLVSFVVLKGKVEPVLKTHPYMNQCLQMFYQILYLINQRRRQINQNGS